MLELLRSLTKKEIILLCIATFFIMTTLILFIINIVKAKKEKEIADISVKLSIIRSEMSLLTQKMDELNTSVLAANPVIKPMQINNDPVTETINKVKLGRIRKN